MMNLTLGWLEELGGLEAVGARNQRKAALVYGAIDAQRDFYRCPVEPDSRSLMNVVFRLPSEALEKQFISEAKAQGMGGLKGHRSVGGIRASLYNAMPEAGAQALADFMGDFARTHG
jgi:phosphoserine aminotransferase